MSWFDEHLHAVNTTLFSFNQNLQRVQLGLPHFGVRYQSDLTPYFDRVFAAGRQFGENFRYEILSTIDTDRPLVRFNNEGVCVYHPLSTSSVCEVESTLRLFEFLFQKNIEFFLNWLAVYVCRNHVLLPHIVLTGERGIGKGTVMDFVSRLFPPILSDVMRTLPTDFNDYCQKKFLGLDEFTGKEQRLYALLKNFQGSKTLSVNPKGRDRYKVRNNMSIIIASNDFNPIYCELSELPEVEDRNPWFVPDLEHVSPGRFPLTTAQVHDVVEGAPNFAREALIPRYRKLEVEGVIARKLRWAIPCPITPGLQRMFNESISELSYFADRVYDAIASQAREERAITEGMIAKLFEERTIDNPQRFGVRAIINRLKDLGRIAKSRTVLTRATGGKGYKMLKFPDKKIQGPTPSHTESGSLPF